MKHEGQESPILTFHVTLLHPEMIFVRLPYAKKRQTRIDEITGGNPYGASTIVGGVGSCQLSENEFAMARYRADI